MYLKALKNIFIQNRVYFLAYLLFLAAGLIVQFSIPQFEITLFINGLHNESFDLFFKTITDLGDGIFATAVVLIIILFRRKYWLSAILSFSLSSLFTQFLKHYAFPEKFRPGMLMKNFSQLHYVDGVYMNELNSFPSGHSTTAFAVFTFIILMNQTKKYQILFLILATLIGFSRIYLLQHFFEDVISGSFIGVVFSVLIFSFFEMLELKKEK